MSFAFPIAPLPDECLGGLVVRATAENLRRNPLRELHRAGIVTNAPQSLCSRSSNLAQAIADFVGSADVDAIVAKFHTPIVGGRVDFFGEPLRTFYRDASRRRVSPRALKNGEYMRAVWSLKPFGFDPSTKERLLDACPVCTRPLGWTLTYGISFCDHCSRTESFLGATWHYPGVDLRQFEQPLVEVEDVEGLDFVTALIDPSPGRKEAARRRAPGMWSELSNGDIFEVALSFASMQNAAHWDKNGNGLRRREKSGEGWENFTPEVLSVAGRTILDGQAGIERFGDLLRNHGRDKPREKTYGWMSELGPLGVADPNLAGKAQQILGRAVEMYYRSRQDPDMKPLSHLAENHGVGRPGLAALARSGSVPIVRFDRLEKAPVLMSENALIPLVRQMRESISGTLAAPRLGVHRMHLEELEHRGLLDRVEGPVLKLLRSDIYYTRRSVEDLVSRIDARIARSDGREVIRLKVALRSLDTGSVPWPDIIVAIVEGRLPVTCLKPNGSLGERLAVADARALSAVMNRRDKPLSPISAEWIGRGLAAEILGTNEVAVWRLAKAGKLKQHGDAPADAPFKRAEVVRLAKDSIFTPEIVRIGRFRTYREASGWLAAAGIAPLMELKKAGWKLYGRGKVERALEARARALPPKPPRKLPPRRPKGVLHGPETSEGRLAGAREARDPSLVGFPTAASILGCSIFAVQKLVAIGRLKAKGTVTPFERKEVESLATKIVFVQEIMRRSGYGSHRGAMKWLKAEGIRPQLYLKEGKVPVFDRPGIEKILGTPISVGGAHPREVKAKLLNLVGSGTNVHQASIACGVNYATAKAWVRRDREDAACSVA